MVEVVSEFFQVTGIDMVPPGTMGELIPYLIKIFIGVCLVSGVFRVIGRLGECILNWSRFK